MNFRRFWRASALIFSLAFHKMNPSDGLINVEVGEDIASLEERFLSLGMGING